MLIIDTNIVLRYMLDDNPELSGRAHDIVTDNDVFLITQVVAEAVYVLEKVYQSTRKEISECLSVFFSNERVTVENHDVVEFAINEYKNSKLDFVDILLFSYFKIRGNKVSTFDKKLKVMIEKG